MGLQARAGCGVRRQRMKRLSFVDRRVPEGEARVTASGLARAYRGKLQGEGSGGPSPASSRAAGTGGEE